MSSVGKVRSRQTLLDLLGDGPNGGIVTPAILRDIIASAGLPFAVYGGPQIAAPADATKDVLATINVPPNCMGPNGVIELDLFFSAFGAGGSRTLFVDWGAYTLWTVVNAAAVLSVNAKLVIFNRNATNAQICLPDSPGGFGPSNAAQGALAAIDTTIASQIVISGQKASAGDALRLECYRAKSYFNE